MSIAMGGGTVWLQEAGVSPSIPQWLPEPWPPGAGPSQAQPVRRRWPDASRITASPWRLSSAAHCVWGSSSRKKPPRSSGPALPGRRRGGRARQRPRRSRGRTGSTLVSRSFRTGTRRCEARSRGRCAGVADARPARERGDQAVAAALGCDRDERRVGRPGDGRLPAPVRREQPDRVLLDDAVDPFPGSPGVPRPSTNPSSSPASATPVVQTIAATASPPSSRSRRRRR